MVTILLVDDHAILRQGLTALLSAEPDFQIAGEGSNGQEALSRLQELKPDVMILDIMMPGMNGLEVTRQAKLLSPDTHIVILSMHSKEVYVADALRNGASGYVLKEDSQRDLVTAVREVMAGNRYLSPSLDEAVVTAYLHNDDRLEDDPLSKLTPREHEIFQLALEGLTSTESAERLGISARTVEVHRANLMRKLGLHSQSELLLYAFKRGIVGIQ